MTEPIKFGKYRRKKKITYQAHRAGVVKRGGFTGYIVRPLYGKEFLVIDRAMREAKRNGWHNIIVREYGYENKTWSRYGVQYAYMFLLDRKTGQWEREGR